ncbi:hypothetical protein OHA25_47240 [Nonomuraea sp. NBC_00507]|uniref:hypothetical protein n=1 Tax=Nonomuraea sp. NBC_00507 TaxID=2976002 RepID=UPI002E183830
MTTATRVWSPAGRLARELAGHLGRRGISSQISECEGIALVGVWSVGLTVWCEWGPTGWRFRWSLSDTSAPGPWRYTSCPCSAMETAVGRIMRLYTERYWRMYGAAPEGAQHRSEAGEDGRA